ncbi:MAG: RNA polymerase sigma factor RpoD/SigA [Ignavibacteriaceae bacterium]
MKITKQFLVREGKSLDQYFAEISRYNLLTTEEELDLAVKVEKGDETARNKLIKANLRFVISVAKQYQNQGLSLSDLINEGNLGLIRATKSFDVTRGFKFISYAVWWIRQSITQAIINSSRIVHLPLNVVGNLTKINKASRDFEQEYDRKPTNEELAEILGISVSLVSNAIEVSGADFSIDAPLKNDYNKKNSTLDILPDSNQPLPDANLARESLSKEIGYMLSILTDREAKVLTMIFGIGREKKLTLEEIGENFNLTRERIRQIKENALKKLRNSHYVDKLRIYLQ